MVGSTHSDRQWEVVQYDVISTMSKRMEVRRMPAARTMVQVRRGEKIDDHREIVSAALTVTDIGKLYNTM